MAREAESLLCDFQHPLAIRPLGSRPPTAGPRLAAKLSRSGRLTCLIPDEPSEAGAVSPAPQPVAETVSERTPCDVADVEALSRACSARTGGAMRLGALADAVLPAPAAASLRRRPISGLTKRHNERLQALLRPRPSEGARTAPSSRPALSSPQSSTLAPLLKAAMRLPVVMCLSPKGKRAPAPAAFVDGTEELNPTARREMFDAHIADILGVVDSMELTKGAERKREAASPQSHPLGSLRAVPTLAGGALGKRGVAHSPLSHSPPPPASPEEDMWFLDDEQLVSPDGPGGSGFRRRFGDRSHYSVMVLDALRGNPQAFEAFDAKVARLREEREAERRPLSAAENFRRRNYDDAFRSPRLKDEARERRLRLDNRRRVRAYTLAAQQEEALMERRLAATQDARQERYRRAKQLQVLMVLGVSTVLFSGRVVLWRERMAGGRWTEQKRRMRLLQDAALSLRTLSDQVLSSGEPDRALAIADANQASAQQVAQQVLLSHAWIARFHVRIARKRHAARLLRMVLAAEARRAKMTLLVKRVLRSTRRVQSWWRRHYTCNQCAAEVLARQWRVYVEAHMQVDVDKVHRTLAPQRQAGDGRRSLAGRALLFAPPPAAPPGPDRLAGGPRRVSVAVATTAATRERAASAQPELPVQRQRLSQSGFGHLGVPSDGPRSRRQSVAPPSRRASRVPPPPAQSDSEEPSPCAAESKPHPHRTRRADGDRKWARDQASVVAAARDTLQTLGTNEIELEPPSPIRDALLRMVVTRERKWFRACGRMYREQLAAAQDEWKQLQTMLRAKVAIQPLTEEDRERVRLWQWPLRPHFHRLLQANEMRLLVALAYRVQLQMAKTAAARKCVRGPDDSDSDDEAVELPSVLQDEHEFCERLRKVHADVGLGGVWEGIWVPSAQLRAELADGAWTVSRHDRNTTSRV